jgi:hypothetical protein
MIAGNGLVQALKNRLAGLLFFVVGFALGWAGLWRPLEAAYAGAARVDWDYHAVGLAPLATVFGLYLALTGDREPYRDAERGTLTSLGKVLMAVMALSAFATFVAFKMTLASLGYD